MSVVVEASYSGSCPECETRFEPGELIRKHADAGWGHASCPTRPLEVTAPPCPRCWQIPSASGACGCDT